MLHKNGSIKQIVQWIDDSSNIVIYFLFFTQNRDLFTIWIVWKVLQHIDELINDTVFTEKIRIPHGIVVCPLLLLSL